MELGGHKESTDRSVAILGEVANLMSYFGQWSYTAAVTDKDEESRQVPLALVSVCQLAVAGINGAQAALG